MTWHGEMWGADTGLWHDTLGLPQTLTATLDAATGFDSVAALLSDGGVQRVVATGNGASFYVAQNLWLASLTASPPGRHPEIVAIPAGLIASGHFRWRPGDVLLAISSSGEFRDVVGAIEGPAAGIPCAAITCNPDSTIGRHATAKAVVSVASERAVTHTQAYCGALAASLAVWARLTGDSELATSLRSAVDALPGVLAAAGDWAVDAFASGPLPHAGVAFGSGPAQSAALEAALLMKEVARVPWEGLETREGATSGMYSLGPGQFALSIGHDGDPLLREAELACERTGATVVRLPGAVEDARTAAITSFPAAVAAAVVLARRQRHDVDEPAWTAAYLATARAGGMDADGSTDGAAVRHMNEEEVQEDA